MRSIAACLLGLVTAHASPGRCSDLDRALTVLAKVNMTPAVDAQGRAVACRSNASGPGWVISWDGRCAHGRCWPSVTLPLTLADCPAGIGHAHAPRAAQRSADSGVARPVLRVADRREESPLAGLTTPRALAPRSEAKQEIDVEDELGERARVSYEARWLFTIRPPDIDKLERILAGYRRDKTRTQSGVWKLTRAYHGMRRLAENMVGKEIAVPDWAEHDLADWQKRYPDSPSPHLYKAALLAYQAIAALNDPVARSGYPGGVEAIKARLDDARRYLLDNKAVASKDPFWYALMLNIMRTQAQPMDALLEVLLEGAERAPDYADSYFEVAYAIGTLSREPFKDIETLAQTAVAKSRGTLGDELYSRIYWVAVREIFDFDALRGIQWDWSRMTASMRTVAARYPNQWNIQTFALISCMMQDQPVTAQFMGQARGRPVPQIWGQFEIYEACRSWATAEASPAGEADGGKRKANLTP